MELHQEHLAPMIEWEVDISWGTNRMLAWDGWPTFETLEQRISTKNTVCIYLPCSDGSFFQCYCPRTTNTYSVMDT